MRDTLVAHKQYISEYGMDLPEVQEWKWHTPETDKYITGMYGAGLKNVK